jgi:outer membrane receptor for ferrienterochelin and colicin
VPTKSFRNNAVYGVAGAALIAAASLAGVPALAQDATSTAPADSAVSEVVVTGFRGSLAKALDVKRNEAAAVDSILAEDIGKFPDLNLSESIQRIPGVRSPATAAKVARSRCAGWAPSSPASASTAWRP